MSGSRAPRLVRASVLAAGTALATAVSLAGTGGMARAALSAGHGAAGPVSGRVAGAARAGTISTVAGGAGGPGRATQVDVQPCGVTTGNGRVYLATGQSVRSVNPATDWLTTVAGTGSLSPLGDGGPATSANAETCGMAVDSHGNLLISDTIDFRIRAVAAHPGTFYGQAMTAGDIYTVAGDGSAGDTGDGGPATAAEIDPGTVGVDGAGNLLIPDDQVIRVVAATSGTFYGKAMAAGHIYTVAGSGTIGFAGDGGPATSAEFSFPAAAVVDGDGNLVIADTGNSRIRVVAARTGTFYGKAMTKGDVYTVAGGGTGGLGDGGPATSAELDEPSGLAIDRAGNLVIADGSNLIRVAAVSTGRFYGKAMTAGDIYAVAGNGKAGSAGYGGPATGAELSFPSGVAFDGNGNLLITASGRALAVAARTGTFYRTAMTAGHIYVIASNGAASHQEGTQGFSGDRGPATRALLDFPQAVAVDGAGNLVIDDTWNQRIRVVAAASGTFYGQAMTKGDIDTIAGNGTFGFAGDGGPATEAEMFAPADAVLDQAGNVVIADTGNERIRVVAVKAGTFYGQRMTAGDIYTVAGNGKRGAGGDGGPATHAGFRSPGGVAVDAAGNLVIADTGNNRIRVVAARTGTFYGQHMTAGDIYTAAQVVEPVSVAVDGHGNLVTIDGNTWTVGVFAVTSGTFYGQQMTEGQSYVVAGGGSAGVGDGGPATDASLQDPGGVTVAPSGSLLIADTGESRVRIVPVTSGTFYGQRMAAEHIYTVAGTGAQGYTGDGGPGTSAWIALPMGTAVDGAGNLLIADYDTGRIREVAG